MDTSHENLWRLQWEIKKKMKEFQRGFWIFWHALNENAAESHREINERINGFVSGEFGASF